MHGTWDIKMEQMHSMQPVQLRGAGDREHQPRDNVMMFTDTAEVSRFKQSMGKKRGAQKLDPSVCVSICLFVVVVGTSLGLHACSIST